MSDTPTLRLVTVGLESHGAYALRAGIDRVRADPGAPFAVEWQRFGYDVVAEPDGFSRLGVALASADAVLVQGIHDPVDATAIVEVLVSHRTGPAGPTSLMIVMLAPNAAELRELDRSRTADTPDDGVSDNVAAAFIRVDPDRAVHALTVLAAARWPGHVSDPGWPEATPKRGFWHPMVRSGRELFADWNEFAIEWSARASADRPSTTDRLGRVLMVAMPTQAMPGNDAHLRTIVEACERRGLDVIGWLGDLASPPVVDVPPVDIWLNVSGFTLTGGHGNPNVAFDVELLTGMDTPHLAAVPLFRQSLAAWRESRTGLAPFNVAMQIAVPELEGGAVPLVYGGRDTATDLMRPVEAHTERIASIAANTVRLRRMANEDKKVAIVVFGYHAARGEVGTAAHLDVFASLHTVLRQMAAAGYTVEVPESTEALVDLLVTSDGGGPRTASRVAAEYPAADYVRHAGRHTERVSGFWGRPPGEVDTDGQRLRIHGVRLGNVFIGIQPSFGYDDDPVALLFSDDASPSHSFTAFYTWIGTEFGADVLLHFGTHGALEFMPGKQAGLEPDDWANLLVADLPHYYLYCMNNPSEGTIAKRRSGATLVSYLTPPLDRAGTYGALADLAGEVNRLLGTGDEEAMAAGLDGVHTLAASANVRLDRPDRPDRPDRVDRVDQPVSAEPDPATSYLRRLQAYVDEVERALIPIGMHVVDTGMDAREARITLRAAADYERPARSLPSLTVELERRLIGGTPYTELPPDDPDRQEVERALDMAVEAVIDERRDPPESPVAPDIAAGWHALLGDLRDRLAGNEETGALLRAFRGGYLRPAPGGEPSRSFEALPTGRNTHALDPNRVPTAIAMDRGRRTAEALLEAARSGDGSPDYPAAVAVVLWGIDNVKSGGEGVAQVFALIGVEPLPDPSGRISRFRIRPLQELGRPRIDVVCTLSGVFRDLFGTTIELLDRAFREVAMLDEPPEWNHVRANALSAADEFEIAPVDAATRIWCAPPGQYGSGVNHMVEESAWRSEAELADIYSRRMAHAYGRRLEGVNSERLLRRSLRTVTVAFQNIDSAETSLADTDHYFEYLGGVTAAVAAASGSRPRTYVADSYAARPVVRTLADAMDLESRTRLLNPRWYEAQLEHGYPGVAAIGKRLTNTFGMQATAGAVDDWVFSEAARTFLFDDELRKRLESANPAATSAFADRLLEAHRRGLWAASETDLEQLTELADRLDAAVEGVLDEGTNGGAR